MPVIYDDANHVWNQICKFYAPKEFHGTPIKLYLESLDMDAGSVFSRMAFAVALEMGEYGGVSIPR